eukprot:TRINITY_DN26960_c0_g1_i1.p2 TRINITY_DN26960_c0_g1~~TRINITY_DN26960_c0_g1_i1.p2  ORF type:complete len:381 (+),score=56.25 TRINITY_DN26960_c0_g1_i1:3-1145(+)
MDHPMIGKHKQEVDTPCLLLNKERLKENITTMQKFAESHGKGLRPHCKTHKCSTIAKLQIEAGAVGVCVAKLGEAEAFVRDGVRKILITSPVVPQPKIQRLLALVQQSSDIMVCVDNMTNATALNAAAEKQGLTLKVIVEMDAGQNRTGVPEGEMVQFCKHVHEKLNSLQFCGIQRYAGHLQHVTSFEERREKSLAVMKGAAEIVQQLKKDGISCDVLTGSGTGTHEIDVEVPEVTDMQVGSYVVMDSEYKNIQGKQTPQFSPRVQPDTPPMTLLSTVISTSASATGIYTLDAGLKAMYKDGPGPEILSPKGDFSYRWNGDEHGQLIVNSGTPNVQLGDVVELLVSHCDPTVNLFDNFYVLDNNDQVVEVWPVNGRGKCE